MQACSDLYTVTTPCKFKWPFLQLDVRVQIPLASFHNKRRCPHGQYHSKNMQDASDFCTAACGYVQASRVGGQLSWRLVPCFKRGQGKTPITRIYDSIVQLHWSLWICSEEKELELLPQDTVLKKRIPQVTNLRTPPLRAVWQILDLVSCLSLREQLLLRVWTHTVEVQLLVRLPLQKDTAHGSKSFLSRHVSCSALPRPCPQSQHNPLLRACLWGFALYFLWSLALLCLNLRSGRPSNVKQAWE